MNTPPAELRRYSVHGAPAIIACEVPQIDQELRWMLGEFVTPDFPAGFAPITGLIQPYLEKDVLRHISSRAKPIKYPGLALETFQEKECFWIVDERWGLTQLDVLKKQWRSWVLPNRSIDSIRCAEMAVLWPLAQLLRSKALYLTPAISVVRNDWSALIIAPFSIEPELRAMIRAGYKIVGQRWTALREDDGKIGLFRMPGRVQRALRPQLRNHASTVEEGWVDPAGEYLGSQANHSFCDVVLIASAGRRPRAHINEIPATDAPLALRRAWPIAELHPQWRRGGIGLHVGKKCRCALIQLSSRGEDILPLLDAMREGHVGLRIGRVSMTVDLNPNLISPAA